MDQQPHQPSMDLPAPQVEPGPAQSEAPLGGVDASEAQLGVAAEQPGSATPANPLHSLPAAPKASAPADPALTVPVPTGGVPLIADDSDLIEKEWVDKAKHIVEQTKHDPHQQTKAVNRVKADYLKQRYQKDIKLSDE